jgi:hypothetical protein
LENTLKDKTLATEKVAKAQASVIEAEKEFDYINVNLDDIEYINGFLVMANVDDTVTRLKFITALLEARENAYASQIFPGVEKSTLDNLISKFNLQDKIQARGNSSIAIKR